LRTALIGAKERSKIEVQEAVAMVESALAGREILELLAGINKLCASVPIAPALRVNGKSVRGVGSNECGRR
jgi:hypothetical protein